MTSASLLAALISLSPPAVLAFEPPSSTAEPPPPTLEDSSKISYEQAIENVNIAMAKANEDPSLGAAPLRDALSLLRDHAPRLAVDLAGQELRTSAQLTLARALLAANDADGAREAMDEAIRTSRGDPLPTKNFGPGLVALHREREGVLAKQGTGSIEVRCHTPCSVFINERRAEQSVDGLVPGGYRVWIEANDASVPTKSEVAKIERDGQVVEIEFGTPVIEPPVVPEKPKKARLLPRWADILIMSAGAAAIGTGAALLAIDDKCPDLADPVTAQCPEVFTTKTAGIVTLAAGGAVFLTGTVLLSVDEVRDANNNKRTSGVTLSWTMRF